MKKLAYLFAVLSAQLSALHFYRVRSAKGTILAAPKMLAGALAPYLALSGLVGAGLGLLLRAPFALGAGLFGLVTSGRYVWRVVTATGDFEATFGANWQERISRSRQEHMLGGRWTWRPAKPPEPRWQQDIPFWTIPGSERPLLCDIWQPPADILPSGLAFIYLHGSGWHYLDKDKGTRPLFRHLAAQGHVIMDVAYRLCPETNWRGMVADAKRAIAWMKANAVRLNVDPARIVIAGGSAGGHLALLAAYTAQRVDLRPTDVGDADLSVGGVVSWYGPTDMCTYYDYAGQKFDTIIQHNQRKQGTDQVNEWVYSHMGIDMTPMNAWQPGLSVQDNMMSALFGGTPAQVPDEYRLGSPITHVDPYCPPTLLLQGADDFIVSAEAVQVLADRLRQAGVPVVHVEYPQTDHAFDLILPHLSPAAQAALYETERFLALLVGNQTAPIKVVISEHIGDSHVYSKSPII
jgi:acetyl esterase/lipase